MANCPIGNELSILVSVITRISILFWINWFSSSNFPEIEFIFKLPIRSLFLYLTLKLYRLFRSLFTSSWATVFSICAEDPESCPKLSLQFMCQILDVKLIALIKLFASLHVPPFVK